MEAPVGAVPTLKNKVCLRVTHANRGRLRHRFAREALYSVAAWIEQGITPLDTKIGMNVAGVSVLLFLSALAASCSANTYRMGACPRVTVMKNIDFDKFLGDWYVAQRFNPMATCTKLTIEKGPEDKYYLNETSRPFGFNFNFHQQYLKARKLNFLRNDTNSIFRLQRNFAHFSLSTFGIVDTDYDSYAVVWGCDPVLFGSVQNVDILTREPNPSKDIIKKARDAMKEMNVDIHPLDNVDHTRCNSDNEDAKNEADKNTNNIIVDP